MNTVVRMVVIVAACSAFAASAAFAQAPGWSYVEAGYLSVDPDNLSGSGDNWFAGASFNILKSFHVLGQYLDGDVADGVSQTYWDIGFGWHGGLGEKADIVAEAHWVDTEVSDVGDDGYGLTGGVRWKLAKIFEVDGFVNYVDLSDGGSDTSYEGRFIVDVWRLGLGASYEMADEYDQWNVFARFYLGGK